ncbi:MAG: DedA family protein [Candidatus Colwellbacteria bacterium]|nr:DedA family protein [Candidatus Colwellbacteria bacterium]
MLETILAVISGFILNTIAVLGYPGIFLLMFLGNANIPIPSEIIMTFSGFVVGMGDFSFWMVVLVGTLGDMSGSLLSYFIANQLSGRLETSGDFKRAENWYKRFGAASLFFGKLVPFVRAFIAFPAGIFKVKLWKFLLLVGSGALIWSTVLTYIGFVLGGNWATIEPYFRKFDFVVAGLIVIALIWWLRHRIRK